MKRGLLMQIKYVENIKSNLDMTNKKILRASILRIVQQSIIRNHLDFDLALNNDFYKDEEISIIFKSEHLGLNNNLLIITNYRIVNISQSTIDTIINGENANENNIKDNFLFIDLSSCQDNLYDGSYSLILKYGDNKKLIINANTEHDATFIKKSIKPLILNNNEKMVETYNTLIEEKNTQPFDISSLKIDPKEKTVQDAIQEEADVTNDTNSKKKDSRQEIQDQSKTEEEDNDAKENKCRFSFGPAPKGYHQVDIIYAQGPTINWISNNGNFPKGMDKALEELVKIMDDDEFVCNLRFTTQNMGDTFAVNLAGDLYKKD